jgi:hypothetical protein
MKGVVDSTHSHGRRASATLHMTAAVLSGPNMTGVFRCLEMCPPQHLRKSGSKPYIEVK